jgi:hypothetical protein
MGRCHALTLGTAALLTMNHSPNRRTLQFPVMSGNIALSDIDQNDKSDGQDHRQIGRNAAIHAIGCAGICETGTGAWLSRGSGGLSRRAESGGDASPQRERPDLSASCTLPCPSASLASRTEIA